ncbi:transmembrane protein, putative [Medicago truncatula]|uniref:Transmembrane protein, putative n=1 Tax=Medicago truncatula TaxID=3880 RepID=A0A072TUK1_MEDTR|nr:transmembrane protein, putative [Medicago truncatula]
MRQTSLLIINFILTLSLLLVLNMSELAILLKRMRAMLNWLLYRSPYFVGTLKCRLKKDLHQQSHD